MVHTTCYCLVNIVVVVVVVIICFTHSKRIRSKICKVLPSWQILSTKQLAAETAVLLPPQTLIILRVRLHVEI